MSVSCAICERGVGWRWAPASALLSAPRTLWDALANSGLPVERLDLEIAEIILADNSQGTLAVLYQSRSAAVSPWRISARANSRGVSAALPVRRDQDRSVIREGQCRLLGHIARRRCACAGVGMQARQRCRVGQ